MSNLIPHQEFFLGLVVALAPILLPQVNQTLAKVFGNKYVKKGFQVAKALEDGLTIDELTEAKLRSLL